MCSAADMPSMHEAFARLDRFVARQMQAANTPAVAVALTDRHALLHVAAHGLSDVAARAPVTPDTLFEIGSISKSFTAIALLQLHESGQVDVNAPVSRYLPWWYIPSSYEPITLHHLLSHTAGIIRGTDFTTESRYEVWALRETEVAAPPGTHYHYSNAGYKALGLVLEEVLGASYGQIIQQRILDPLGMAATEPVISHDTRKRLAVGYEPFYDDRPSHPSHPLVPATWFENATADGSIATTATDLATYLRMLINQGQVPGGRILSEEGFRLMTQKVIEPPEGDEDHGTFYGYGLSLDEEEGHAIISHTGGMVGYYAALRADLDDGLGAVVLTNGPGNPDEIARYALKLVRAALSGLELPSLPPEPDPARVENAAEYAGTYRGVRRSFDLAADGERLVLHYAGERFTLERRRKDGFYVPHPDFALFLLSFGRDGDKVVEAFHGPDWYANEGYGGPMAFDHPPDWRAYPGHYRSHNPWYTNFRVVLRQGKLLLVEPWGEEQVLIPLGGGVFRIGIDALSPERLRFDTILHGQATRANQSGCDYYRTFTP